MSREIRRQRQVAIVPGAQSSLLFLSLSQSKQTMITIMVLNATAYRLLLCIDFTRKFATPKLQLKSTAAGIVREDGWWDTRRQTTTTRYRRWGKKRGHHVFLLPTRTDAEIFLRRYLFALIAKSRREKLWGNRLATNGPQKLKAAKFRKIFLRITKLSEMCGKKICHYWSYFVDINLYFYLQVNFRPKNIWLLFFDN